MKSPHASHKLHDDTEEHQEVVDNFLDDDNFGSHQVLNSKKKYVPPRKKQVRQDEEPVLNEPETKSPGEQAAPEEVQAAPEVEQAAPEVEQATLEVESTNL